MNINNTCQINSQIVLTNTTNDMQKSLMNGIDPEMTKI